MTEIGNTSSSAQVVDLRPARSSSASVGIDRFSAANGPEKSGQAPAELAAPVPNADQADGKKKSPLEKAAAALEKFIPEDEQVPNTRLRIDKDDETGRFIYLNIDNESGEVIKQFPPESILEFLSYYREVAGLTVDDKA